MVPWRQRVCGISLPYSEGSLRCQLSLLPLEGIDWWWKLVIEAYIPVVISGFIGLMNGQWVSRNPDFETLNAGGNRGLS